MEGAGDLCKPRKRFRLHIESLECWFCCCLRASERAAIDCGHGPFGGSFGECVSLPESGLGQAVDCIIGIAVADKSETHIGFRKA